jgi:hypothetical protein
MYLRYATDSGVDHVVVSHGVGNLTNGWALSLNESIPRSGDPLLTLILEESDVRYHVTIVTQGMTEAALQSIPLTSVFNASQAKTRDLFLNHKAEIYGALTAVAVSIPTPPVIESTVPDARYFYRVIERQVDTNGNGLYDWWELDQNYDPFLALNDPRAASANTRDQQTGQTHVQQQASQTPPSAGSPPGNPVNNLSSEDDDEYTREVEELLGTNPEKEDSDDDEVWDHFDAHPTEALLTFAKRCQPRYVKIDIAAGEFIDANNSGAVLYKNVLNEITTFTYKGGTAEDEIAYADKIEVPGSGSPPLHSLYQYTKMDEGSLTVGHGQDTQFVSNQNPRVFSKGFKRDHEDGLGPQWFGPEAGSENNPEEPEEPNAILEYGGSCLIGYQPFSFSAMSSKVEFTDNYGNVYGRRSRTFSSGVVKATSSVPNMDASEAPIRWKNGGSGMLIPGGEKTIFDPSDGGGGTKQVKLVNLVTVTPEGRGIIAKTAVTFKSKKTTLPSNTPENPCEWELLKIDFAEDKEIKPTRLDTTYFQSEHAPANEGIGIPNASIILAGSGSPVEPGDPKSEVCCLNDMARGQKVAGNPQSYGTGPIAGGMKDGKACFWAYTNGAWQIGYVKTAATGKPTQQVDGKVKFIEDNGRMWVEKNGETSLHLWYHGQLIPLSELVPGAAGEVKKITSKGIIAVQDGDFIKLLVLVEAAIDYSRDGKIDSSDTRPAALAHQGSYKNSGEFDQKGAIIWANLDYDEENLAEGKPIPDTIRFWHDGLTFEHSDEDFVIKNGERTIAPFLPGYEPPPSDEIRSACPDLAPIKLSRLNSLPADSKILLKVARAEDLKAFHFYKRIPDFSLNDSEETAIWGAFQQSGAPWAGEDHIVDDRTIDLSKWVNEKAENYVGYQETRRTEVAPFVFGVEALLYKGMKYDFSGGTGGKEFDGNLDFTLILKDSQGQETVIDRFRFTCLRLPAFPGAEGFGKWASGGRGGEVYVVNNLNSSGPGSFRAAIEERTALPSAAFPQTERKKPRTVVFASDGLVRDTSQAPWNITRGQLTIAGQSAPTHGITLMDGTLQIKGAEGASGKSINRPNDCIIRYLRLRRNLAVSTIPSAEETDGLWIKSASRIIVDHCSISWASDDGVLVGGAINGNNEQPEMVVTLQWCNVNHVHRPHSKLLHLYGKFGARFSVLKSFLGYNDERLPRFSWQQLAGQNVDDQGVLIDFRQNLLTAWHDDDCGLIDQASRKVRLNLIGNNYWPGEDSPSAHETYGPLISQGHKLFVNYGQDNHFYSNSNQWKDQSWRFSQRDEIWNPGYPTNNSGFRDHAYITEDGTEAWCPKAEILTKAGYSRWRDAADAAYTEDVGAQQLETSDLLDEGAPATWSPLSASYSRPSSYDADSDGMADSWELAVKSYLHTDKDVLPWQDADGDGWTNLEEFLNRTHPGIGDDPMKASESHITGDLAELP